MLWTIVGVLLLAVLVVGSVLLALFWLVKSRYRNKPASDLGIGTGGVSKISECAKCGERRVIVREDDGLCASCYSALRTKVLS
jgi:hypothetical protein